MKELVIWGRVDDVVKEMVELSEDIGELVTLSSVEDMVPLMLESKDIVVACVLLWVSDVVEELVIKMEEVVEELTRSLWLEYVVLLLVGIVDNAEEVEVESEEIVEVIITLEVENAEEVEVEVEELAEELTVSLWVKSLLVGIVVELATTAWEDLEAILDILAAVVIPVEL